MTDKVIGRTDTLLYRRGNFNGTFDDLICNALLEERDAEISLSPGFRWGASLVPGQDITLNDVYNQTAITYPAVYRLKFTGQFPEGPCWKTSPTISSTPIPTISRAGIWCASAG